MRLQKLTSLEVDKVVEEYNELQERINELQNKLEDPWEDEDEGGGLVVRK